MIPTTFLYVWANPWHALDHLGRPAGHCPRERKPSTIGHAGYVGCRCVASEPEKLPVDSAATPDQDTCWQFSTDAQKVEDTPYYRARVRFGELFAANELTAKMCGVKFVPLAKALDAAKAEAVAKWNRAFPDGHPWVSAPATQNPHAAPKPLQKGAVVEEAK